VFAQTKSYNKKLPPTSNLSFWVPLSKNRPNTVALTSGPHVEEEVLPCKDKSFLMSTLVSSISLLFFSVIFLYSSNSLCVLACCSSAIGVSCSGTTPWTQAAHWMLASHLQQQVQPSKPPYQTEISWIENSHI
jgi:hypothetical protein